MFNVLPLTSEGEDHTIINFGDNQAEVVTRYNYASGNWTMDLLDADANPVVCGLALFPGHDVLKPYPDAKALYGSLVPVEEKEGDHLLPESLGDTLRVLWYPVDAAVVLP